MAIKRTNKVKSDFSMSSLTDIIFLLLIFFMLTSSFVSPNALKLVLPTATNQALAKQTIMVNIDKNNSFSVTYEKVQDDVEKENLESVLKAKLKNWEDYEATIVINSDESIPIKEITYVMTVGRHLNQKVILATKPE